MSNNQYFGQETFFNERINAYTGISGDLFGNVTGNITGDIFGYVNGNINSTSGISTLQDVKLNGKLFDGSNTFGSAGQILASDGTKTSWIFAFPSGTTLLFFQADAPIGWTKVTTHDNTALRVVSGTGGGIGGSTAFTSVFTSRTPSGSVSVSGSNSGGSVSNTVLTVDQIPSHSHSITDPGHVHSGAAQHPSSSGPEQDQSGGPENRTLFNINSGSSSTGITINSSGGGQAHNHGFTNPTWSGSASFSGSSMDFAVRYIDLIIASKD